MAYKGGVERVYYYRVTHVTFFTDCCGRDPNKVLATMQVRLKTACAWPTVFCAKILFLMGN